MAISTSIPSPAPAVSDTDYSKGPRSAYAFNENWIIVYLNQAQPDVDDEWGRTERIAVKHLVDHVSSILETLYGPNRSTIDTSGLNGSVNSILSIVDVVNDRITLPNGTPPNIPTTILQDGLLQFDSTNMLTANTLMLGGKLYLSGTNTSSAYISGNGPDSFGGIPSSHSISLGGIGGASGTQSVAITLPVGGSGPGARVSYVFTNTGLSFPSGANINVGGTINAGSMYATGFVASNYLTVGTTNQLINMNPGIIDLSDSDIGYSSEFTSSTLLFKQSTTELLKLDATTLTLSFNTWYVAKPGVTGIHGTYFEMIPPDNTGAGWFAVQASVDPLLYKSYMRPSSISSTINSLGTEMGMTLHPFGLALTTGFSSFGDLDRIFITPTSYQGNPFSHSRVSVLPPVDESSTPGNVEVFQYRTGATVADVVRMDNLGVKGYTYTAGSYSSFSSFELSASKLQMTSIAQFIMGQISFTQVDPVVDSSYNNIYIKLTPGTWNPSIGQALSGSMEIKAQAPSTSAYNKTYLDAFRLDITDSDLAEGQFSSALISLKYIFPSISASMIELLRIAPDPTNSFLKVVMPYLPVSSAGLVPGQVYRSGASANAALMIV